MASLRGQKLADFHLAKDSEVGMACGRGSGVCRCAGCKAVVGGPTARREGAHTKRCQEQPLSLVSGEKTRFGTWP